MKKSLTTVCASCSLDEMSKTLNLAAKVRALKIGQHFIVKTEKERQAASRAAKSLRDAGVIDFDVVTKADGETFKVAAI